jgi:hypothetical protein
MRWPWSKKEKTPTLNRDPLREIVGLDSVATIRTPFGEAVFYKGETKTGALAIEIDLTDTHDVIDITDYQKGGTVHVA